MERRQTRPAACDCPWEFHVAPLVQQAVVHALVSLCYQLCSKRMKEGPPACEAAGGRGQVQVTLVRLGPSSVILPVRLQRWITTFPSLSYL